MNDASLVGPLIAAGESRRDAYEQAGGALQARQSKSDSDRSRVYKFAAAITLSYYRSFLSTSTSATPLAFQRPFHSLLHTFFSSQGKLY